MIDENGNILKQYFIPQYQIDPYIDFHFYNKKLFIEIDERLYVYQNVFASSYDNVEGDGTDDMKINPIRDLVGRSTLMLTNVEGRNVKIVVNEDGSRLLYVKTLNFWNKL